jgi:Ca2+-transporting ATPase
MRPDHGVPPRPLRRRRLRETKAYATVSHRGATPSREPEEERRRISRESAMETERETKGERASRATVGAHARHWQDVFAALETGADGLASTEAAERLASVGRNELPSAPPPSPIVVVARQFANPLIYILLGAAAISAAMGDSSDAGFIALVLVINAAIGSVQELNAEKSARALRAMTSSHARVLRDGHERLVDATTLVPGDVVCIEAGDKVPADLRLFDSGTVAVDESLLTGESLAVAKNGAAVLPSATPVADRTNMAFAGTLVTGGRVHGVVVATRVETQLGQIADSLEGAAEAKPPLLVRMERFTKRIALTVLLAVLLLGAFAFARGTPAKDVFLLAVALAVSAIPEGLPVALTVALSIGARRMAGRKVIARRLVAVEALGSCTFIASDKTGTLTMNELSARVVSLPDGGRFEATSRVDAGTHDRLHRFAEAATLCNDGVRERRGDEWSQHGDAVDLALLALADDLGVDRIALAARHPRRGSIPFESERGYAATLHTTRNGLRIAVKGAGERVLPMCTQMATADGDRPIDTTRVEAAATMLASDGYRVLAVAERRAASASRQDAGINEEHLRDLTLLGLVGMVDPLRPEAKACIEACQKAGIGVAMVTGDHPVTALAIARELGLTDDDHVVTGPMLARAGDDGPDAIDALVRGSHVFARVEPVQKLQIVQSLIRLGHFVAVTGDGANDAPALRASHIGVAMGARGTDVARENADLILTDDNFASIVAGVEEGRIAYANVRKVIFLLVSSGAAELLLFVMTTAAGLPIPLRPVQLLWLNLVTNGIQDVALAFEPGEGGELERRPRPPSEAIFDKTMIERTLMSAAVMATVAFAAYRWMLDHDWSLVRAQSGVLLLLVLFENVQAGNSRSEHRSLFALSPLRNPFLFVGTLAAQLLHVAAIHTPWLADLLHLAPVTVEQWVASLALASTLLVASECQKALARRRTPS